MSAPPIKTTFTPRGRLNGVLRDNSHRRQGQPRRRNQQQLGRSAAELDTEAFEALYYRARLILGDTLPRPARP